VRWLPLVQFVVGLALVALPAQAGPGEGPPYVLTYEAPAGCPGEAVIGGDVAHHVHDQSRAAGVRLRLTIEEDETGYLGILVTFDESGNEGSRRIHGKTCFEVAHALAFLAGLVIELGGHLETAAPPAPMPSAPPPPSTAPPAPPVVEPAHPIDVSTVVLAGTRGGFGPTVRVTGETGVDISARSGIVAPSARLSGFAGDSSLGVGGGSAALWFVGGRLEVCPLRFGNAHVVLRPCAGGEIGWVHAQGQIAIDPRTAIDLWASAEATLRLQWFATRSFFAELGGGPEFPILRTRYYFEPNQVLYVVPWLTARAAIGIGLQF
jgi:hypothetical protein